MHQHKHNHSSVPTFTYTALPSCVITNTDPYADKNTTSCVGSTLAIGGNCTQSCVAGHYVDPAKNTAVAQCLPPSTDTMAAIAVRGAQDDKMVRDIVYPLCP